MVEILNEKAFEAYSDRIEGEVGFIQFNENIEDWAKNFTSKEKDESYILPGSEGQFEKGHEFDMDKVDKMFNEFKMDQVDLCDDPEKTFEVWNNPYNIDPNKIRIPDFKIEILNKPITAPTVQEFEVWSSGFSATGCSGRAMFHGKFKGTTFKDAVLAFKESVTDPYSKSCIHVESLTYWGCKLFDNGKDARKSFG